jgi:hypothetical protein
MENLNIPHAFYSDLLDIFAMQHTMLHTMKLLTDSFIVDLSFVGGVE